MESAAQLEKALAELAAAGPVEVHENGRWVAPLAACQYEVRSRGTSLLFHLWSEEQNLVRRVLRVKERTAGRLSLDVQRFGRSKPDSLEFVLAGSDPAVHRVTREKFRVRFQRLLAEQFGDEHIDKLTMSSDLEHSFSGRYSRGIMHRGQTAWAVLGVSAGEDAAAVDAVLTYGLIWLDWARSHAQRRSIAGLRLFLPAGAGRITCHRLAALESTMRVELYEFDDTLGRVRPVDVRDVGNLATWLTPRREVEAILARAREALAPILKLDPHAIAASLAPGGQDVALRFRGIEFARWCGGNVSFGLGEDCRLLSSRNHRALEQLVVDLQTFRRALTREASHPLYRLQAERWLESMVQADPARIDPRLDPRFLYAQVPAFSAGDRSVIDLLGVTQDGRLVVIELKAAEDIHLVLQAADYWLRVKWHHAQDDYRRYGYFPGIFLKPEPPLLYLVAPGFRFHPATDVVLRYLSPEIEISRVGLNENWRRGLRVVFRQ